MGVALAVSLLAFAGAHVALVVGLWRARPRWRAAAALFVAPLAPWWGWRAGLRGATYAWGAALAAYALGVALTGR